MPFLLGGAEEEVVVVTPPADLVALRAGPPEAELLALVEHRGEFLISAARHGSYSPTGPRYRPNITPGRSHRQRPSSVRLLPGT